MRYSKYEEFLFDGYEPEEGSEEEVLPTPPVADPLPAQRYPVLSAEESHQRRMDVMYFPFGRR